MAGEDGLLEPLTPKSVIQHQQFLIADSYINDLLRNGATESETSNNSANISEGNATIHDLYEGPEEYIVPIVFGLIFFAGIIGNGTLIYTVLMNKTMRNAPNILLVSLAIGDLCLILFTVPLMSTTYTFSEWPYGSTLCKLGEFTVTLSLGVSVFTLTALSAERYMVIVHPMSAVHRGTSSATTRSILVAVGIWIVSAALASVELFAAHLNFSVLDGRTMTICYAYPNEWGEAYVTFHVVFRFAVYFAVPIVAIGVFYALMARILMVSTVQCPGDGVKGQAVKQLEARKKVARLVLSFVAVFVVCWLPRHVWYFWYHFDEYGEYNMFWHVFKIAAFCLSFINSCVNPFALYFLSRQFRHYYHRYLCCLCSPRCSSPLDGGSTSLAGGGERDGASHGRGGARHMIGGAETCQLVTLNTVPRTKKQPNPSVTMVTTLA